MIQSIGKKRRCSDSMRRTGANAVLFLGESRRRGTDSTRKPYVSQRDLTTNTDTLCIRIPCRTREKGEGKLQTSIEDHSGLFLCRWNWIRGISSAVSSRSWQPPWTAAIGAARQGSWPFEDDSEDNKQDACVHERKQVYSQERQVKSSDSKANKRQCKCK